MAAPTLLQLDGISVTYPGAVAAVEGVSLSVAEGEVHGLVGESGSGKTSIASAILGMLAPSALTSGSIGFMGHELLHLSDRQRRDIRGRLIAFIPQNPMSALNPVLTVGYQLVETIRVHGNATRREAEVLAADMLRQVGLPDPARALRRYPHEFSGGTAQRILIAIALVNGPRLVVADEPTSALDATVQRQIVELLATLVATRQMAMLLISHDLGTVGSLSDRISVMYAGQVVESGPVQSILRRPCHPYTEALVAASRGKAAHVKRAEGDPRRLATCRFLPRCPASVATCHGPAPTLLRLADGQRVRCHLVAAQAAA